MNNYIPTYTDITEWQINVYQNTGGTRSKKIAIHPDSFKEYFFKGSKEIPLTGEVRYPTEFWSEIVSSKIGQHLGFNVLDYNIGYTSNSLIKQKIGCLSKSMVENSENKLTEGKVYLTGLNSSYNPKKDKKDYTFQFILDALKAFNLEKYITKLIEVIVYDSIIGNSDRHQENWGFIVYYSESLRALESDFKKKDKGVFEKFSIKLKQMMVKLLSYNADILEDRKISKSTLKKQTELIKSEFSQIYDNGCCLGREISDAKIGLYLNNQQKIDSYVNKGKSEIHWENKKKRHLELITLISKVDKTIVSEIVESVKSKYNQLEIEQIIRNIDKNIPDNLSNYKLSSDRKELMIKLITLRTQKLFKLF